MIAVDTNVLIYASDPRDPIKRSTAIQRIENLTDGVLLWQVACEYLAAARKLAPFGFSEQEALREMEALRQARQTLLPTWHVFDAAAQLRSQYSLSTWDSLIVAQCLEGGVAQLLTEYFDAYPQIASLQITNPFAP